MSEAATATSPSPVDEGFRVVQRLVLPDDQELDVQSLYVSGVTSFSSGGDSMSRQSGGDYASVDEAPDADEDEEGNVAPQIGDYICRAKTANVPQVPQEFHPVLAQMVNLRLMACLGDSTKYQVETAELERLKSAAIALISNRVEAQPSRVVNNKGFRSSSGSQFR